MKTTIIGQLVTRDGANMRSYFSPLPEHFWQPIQHKIWVVPAAEVRSVQQPEIPLRLAHGEPAVGRIVHLERRAADGSIWAVGEVDEDIRPEDRDYFLSVEATYDDGTIGSDIEIRGAAICEKSCMIGLQPATLLRSGLDQHGKRPALSTFQTGLLEHADHARRARRRGEPIVVEGAGATVERTSAAGYELDRRSIGEVELRSAAAVDVNRARREVDMLIAPAETPTVIYERGKQYTEVFSHGAFAETDAARVKVNRDHVRERVLGRVLHLDAWDEAGLTGTAKLARTRDADEALALLDDELLGVSAGFAIARNGGDEWRGSHRRVRRAQLDHVALVAEAAYPTARVTAVRSDALALR